MQRRHGPARSTILALILASLLIGGGGAAAMPTSQTPTPTDRAADAVPRIETGKCAWDLPKGQKEGETVRCGALIVAEQHANPTGRTIRLPFMVFKSASATPAADPIIYIEGGPGGSASTFISDYLPDELDAIIANRDLIVFEQRGVGKAEPALDCPEIAEVALRDAVVYLSASEATDHQVAAALACKDRLAGQGITLAAYNSAEGAADINDLRAQLGYDKLDLLGVSYGTRVALTVMRDFPGIVRSAVLDSTVPLQANTLEDDGANFDRSLKLLFVACIVDASCGVKYPNIARDFTAVFTALNDKPLTVPVKDKKAGKEIPVVVDGNSVVGLISEILYYDQALKIIPPMIDELTRRESAITKAIITLLGVTGPDISHGAYFSVQCAEEIPFNDQEKALANTQTLAPELRENFREGVRGAYLVCAQWPAPTPNPVETQPVTSDIPSLVLSSANDPATPPMYGEATVQTLPKGFLIPFPGLGHSILGNGGECGLNTILAFINTPTTKPPTDCVATA